MAAPRLTLYFDIISPFAYLAFHIVRVSLAQPMNGSGGPPRTVFQDSRIVYKNFTTGSVNTASAAFSYQS